MMTTLPLATEQGNLRMPASTMVKVLDLLRQPGRKTEVRGVAPTPMHVDQAHAASDEEAKGQDFVKPINRRRLDRWLDIVVDFAGSQYMFFAIVVGLCIWALLGIRFGRTTNWQVLISDVQALLCYVYDSLLTRQQLNAYGNDMSVVAQLKSRSQSHLRMLRILKEEMKSEEEGLKNKSKSLTIVSENELALQLPRETRFGRVVTSSAAALGHIITLTLFWVGVFVWLGIGPLMEWSNSWQLYMNSATSALMVFTFALLANIGQRHGHHTQDSLEFLFAADSSLELELRWLTHDTEPNEEVVFAAPSMNKIQRAIFYYADFVGTLTGIAILTVVICVWIAIGPALHYDSNWWLLIGTYAGLIGMFDAFILRNMQARLRSYTNRAVQTLHENDRIAFELVGQVYPQLPVDMNISISTRISRTIDRITTHEFAVVAALFTMFGLVAGSSAMKWSLTGQLLSNVPPSIIESWLMLVLITGHNLIEDRRRQELQTLYERRLQLLAWTRCFGKR